MQGNSRLAKCRFVFSLSLAALGGLDSAIAADPGPVEMSFMKGDTRNGSKVHIRVLGDSLYYREVTYYPNSAPLESRKAMLLSGPRRKALKSVMGELPRYPTFGSCFGKDMRFYMVETAGGKFYRSLPGRAGKCYPDEPDIWSLFQDLDDLLAPPGDPDYREYSAS
ncbi:MAG TPA: hypothetical protein VJ385_19895 [Fibrobacteria bacterium]|nr:hypothetical protein [Fibrobacteria bacterium]